MVVKLRLMLGILIGIVGLLAIRGISYAQTVAQGYSTASTLQYGQIVQLVAKTSGKVEALTQSNSSKMFGVVINPNASVLSLSQTGSGQQVYVSTSGNYPVLVDNENGAIYSGDYVSVSTVAGIGDNAGSNNITVLGKATSNFLGSNDSLGQVNVKEANGRTATLQIGTVTVSINITSNPLHQSNILPIISRFGQNVTNKSVSTIKSYLSLLILLASFIIAGVILYAGIRSSITAVGRNPLSKRSVMRSLAQVIITSFTVVIVGVFAVYLLLRY